MSAVRHAVKAGAEAKEFIHAEHFDSIDTFSIRALPGSAGSEGSSDDSSSNRPGEAPVAAMPSSVPGDAPPVAMSFSTGPLESTDEDSRRYALEIGSLSESVNALRVRCGYMEKGKAVDVPIAPAASLTVKINASGEGVLFFTPAEAVDSIELTIREITLSPFSCTVYGSSSSWDVYPNLRFRMKDGTVLTQAQTLHLVSSETVFEGFSCLSARQSQPVTYSVAGWLFGRAGQALPLYFCKRTRKIDFPAAYALTRSPGAVYNIG